MKVNLINGEHILVCEVCDKPFEVGDVWGMGFTDTVTKLSKFENILFPYGDKVPNMGYQQWYHKKCIENKPVGNSIDSFKEGINALPAKDQLELYKYLYHTHRCRI